MMVTLSLPATCPANERVAKATVSPDSAYKKCLRCIFLASCLVVSFEW